MTDIQQLTDAAQSISGAVTSAAIYGAHITAIVNSIQDGTAMFVFLILIFIAIWWFRKVLKIRNEKELDIVDSMEELGIFSIIGILCSISSGTALLVGILSSSQIFMDFYGLNHPSVYLAYQLIQKISGA